MNKELPDYVLKGNYAYHFLFTESEILQPVFSEKLERFCSVNQIDRYCIELTVPSRYLSFITDTKFEVPSNRFKTFKEFCDDQSILNQGVFLYSFNFFMYDPEGTWEAYVSSVNEMCIFGCSSKIKKSFVSVFEP